LGGYLGPDLTNIISTGDTGEAIVRSVVRSGTRQMPAFEMSDEELNEIISFLGYANTQGTADPRRFQIDASGMIEAK
jgi:nitric oxide reductase subunit C